MFARVTVPFDAPDVYVRPSFGAPVVKGLRFSALLVTGIEVD